MSRHEPRLALCRFLKIRNRFILSFFKMRNCESKIDSFSILLTILLGFDSGIDSKNIDSNRSKNRNRKGIRFDTALNIIWQQIWTFDKFSLPVRWLYPNFSQQRPWVGSLPRRRPGRWRGWCSSGPRAAAAACSPRAGWWTCPSGPSARHECTG